MNDELKALLKKTTAGKWTVAVREDDVTVVATPFPGHGIAVAVCPRYADRRMWAKKDGAAIAALHNEAPRLLADIDALIAALKAGAYHEGIDALPVHLKEALK